MRRAPVAWFVALTAAFTAPFWWYVLAHRGAPAMGDAGYGLMWGPGLAALLVAPPAALGWRWPGRRMIALAWAIPIGYTLLAYVPTWIAGLGRFAGPDQVDLLRDYYRAGDVGDALLVGGGLVAGATLGVLAQAAMALGEELGWRGFLVPALVPRLGVRGAGLASGALWAGWHYPLFFFAPHHGGPPMAWALSCFTVMTVALGVVLAWLRVRSASVWPAVVVHAAHNSFTATCDAMTGATGKTAWVTSETGAALAIAAVAVAVAVWIRAGRDPLPRDAA